MLLSFIATARRAMLAGGMVASLLTLASTRALANPCLEEMRQLEEWERRFHLMAERAEQLIAAKDYKSMCQLDVEAMAAITQYLDAVQNMGQCDSLADARLIARSRATFTAYQKAAAQHCEKAKE